MKNILPLFFILLMISCKSKDETAEAGETKTISTYEAVNKVVGIGKIEPESGIGYLASDQGGIVQQIFKKEGDHFEKGDPILELRQSDAQLHIAQIRARINTGTQQVEADRIRIKEIESQLQNKNNTLQTSRDLSRSGAETRQAVDDLINEKEVLEVQLESAKKTVNLSQSRLNELQSELKSAQNSLNILTIRAPEAGTILAMDPREGGAVQALQNFAEYTADEPWVVHGEIDEMFANRVQVGQTAEIHLMGNAEVLATGTVVYLSQRLENKSLFMEMPGEAQDRRVRRFKVRIENPDNLLLNTKVECEIKIK